VGFGLSAPEIDVGSRASVEDAVHQYLPDAEVVRWWSEDWNGNPHSLGTWTAFRPGQITRLAAASRAPEGRLTFATSEVAVGFSGWIDGAIEAGSTAARQTSDLLVSSAATV